MIEKKGGGTNFVESKHLLEENLTLIYEEGILCERPNDRKTKYDLAKGDLYVIDPAIKQLQVGLGWDAASRGGDIDVDASVIVFNKSGSRYTQDAIVSYKSLNYKNAVVHAGDNRTGTFTLCHRGTLSVLEITLCFDWLSLLWFESAIY